MTIAVSVVGIGGGKYAFDGSANLQTVLREIQFRE